MYSATPTDLIEARRAMLRRSSRVRAAGADHSFAAGKMVVGAGRLMMVVEKRDRSVICVRITGAGSLVVDQFDEGSLTPMGLAYSPRTLLPQAREIPEGLLLQLEEDDKKRREDRRRKSRKPKASKRAKA